MAASEIYDHQSRNGVMNWLYITYFCEDTTLTPYASHDHPPHPHHHQPNLYQIDIPSFLTQSLSQKSAMYSIP